MKQLQLLSLLFALLSLAAAWQLSEENDAAPALDFALGRRQNDNNDNSDSASSSATASDKSASATKSDSSITASNSNSKSASGSDKSASQASKTSGSTKSKTTEFDPRLPAGGISMITPNAQTSQYYKIGDWVTFAWNYTSLSVTPSHIDVLASCSANEATYTLAVNQSVHPTGKVLWDTGAYQKTATVPLLTETYTLIIYDAQSSISATAAAGYLGVFDQWTFGMYLPQSATPLSGYQCATCGSGAMSSMERQTLAFLFGMAGITVLTFTWFANSFGVL